MLIVSRVLLVTLLCQGIALGMVVSSLALALVNAYAFVLLAPYALIGASAIAMGSLYWLDRWEKIHVRPR